MKNKRLLVFVSFAALCLTACGSGNTSKEDTVDVFVLSGQSNMEGSTMYIHPDGTELLKDYMEERELDYDAVVEGLPNVLTSYYGFYHPNGWEQAHSSSEDQSTPEGKLTPNFKPTSVGMGVGDTYQGKKDIFFGPELGIANTLNEYATEERPIYLAKCAFSGSGFHNGVKTGSKPDPDWSGREEDPTISLWYLLKTYTHNCLQAIEETGKTPVLRGLIWHQGESDSGSSTYTDDMLSLINDFNEEFKEYAIDEDVDNIAFLDCTIYDGSKKTYGSNPGVNAHKLAIANESEDDLRFCIDGGFQSENGLKLEIGDDALGGFNTYHYNTSDAYRLGEAYAQIILDNNLIER